MVCKETLYYPRLVVLILLYMDFEVFRLNPFRPLPGQRTRVRGGVNLRIQDHPNEPRQSPPGGNDPSPHGSLNLKGRGHREGGFHQICHGKIGFWIFYGLVFQPHWRFRGLGREDPADNEALEEIEQSAEGTDPE
jgi:hypothetical protein